MHQPFVRGSVATAAGPVPRVDSEWSRADRWGTVKARWGVGRMRYTVVPGLYAIGDPGRSSPVLVTANYKMSFDRLRRAIPGLDAWILVLDTDGINVWCAAGKGTFGTDRLAAAIADTAVDTVVDHRRLILPQLAAPGVAGHLLERRMGFTVVWGPIMAEDLPQFLAAGCVATPEMRRSRFPIGERAALIPVDLVGTGKWLLPAMVVTLFLGGTVHRDGFAAGVLDHGLTGALVLLGAAVAGVVATTLLLPYLPFRAFAAKGAVVGLAFTAAMLVWRGGGHASALLTMEAVAWLLMATAVSAFLAMNFTGSSTFTSLSGVRKEMRYAVPAQIVVLVAGLGLWLGSLWFTGGVG
jgi:acetyl-CoA decarbonylase/synthase complex subunit gamma